MSDTQKSLWLGALKSAVAAACGLVTGLPVLDPDHFNVTTWQGVLRILAMIGWVVFVAEARYWDQWAHSGDSK